MNWQTRFTCSRTTRSIGVRQRDDKEELNPCQKRMHITLTMPLGRRGKAR